MCASWYQSLCKVYVKLFSEELTCSLKKNVSQPLSRKVACQKITRTEFMIEGAPQVTAKACGRGSGDI